MIRQLMSTGARPIVVVSACALSLAQTPSPQFDVSVNVARVEVYVRGPDGEFVSGLEPADFRVVVSGRERTVLAALEVDHAMLRSARVDEGTAESADGLSATMLSGTAPLSGDRNFMVLIDLTQMDARSLRYAREAGVEFLSSVVSAQDRVALAVYSPSRGLELPVPFTTDHATAAEWLRALGTARAMERMAPVGDGIDLASIRGLGGDNARMADFIEEIDGIRVAMGAQDLLGALDELATIMSAVSGSKQVVFFSRGLPDLALADAGFRAEAAGAIGAARRQGVVIHTLDPGILPGSDVHDPSNMGSSYRTDQRDLNDGAALLKMVIPSAMPNRAVLNMLAAETGGTSTFFRHNLGKGLAGLEETSRRHYVLAIPLVPVEDAFDGRVEVSVRQRLDLHVQWLPGSVGTDRHEGEPPSRDQRLLQTAAALEFGDDAHDLAAYFQAEVLSVVDGYGRLAVAIELPFNELERLMSKAGQDGLSFEVLGLAVDTSRFVEDHFRGRIGLANSGQFRERRVPLRYTNVLAVPPGEYYVKLLLRESATGLLASRSVRFMVPAAEEPGLRAAALLPVALDAPVVNGIDTNDLPEHRSGRPMHAPFSFQGVNLAPLLGGELEGGQPFALLVAAFNVQRHPFTGQPSLAVSAEIRPESVAPIPLRMSNLTAEAGEEAGSVKLLVELMMPQQLQSSAYEIVLTITDRISGQVTTASRAMVPGGVKESVPSRD